MRRVPRASGEICAASRQRGTRLPRKPAGCRRAGGGGPSAAGRRGSGVRERESRAGFLPRRRGCRPSLPAGRGPLGSSPPGPRAKNLMTHNSETAVQDAQYRALATAGRDRPRRRAVRKKCRRFATLPTRIAAAMLQTVGHFPHASRPARPHAQRSGLAPPGPARPTGSDAGARPGRSSVDPRALVLSPTPGPSDARAHGHVRPTTTRPRPPPQPGDSDDDPAAGLARRAG
ncbi:hypothetical protein HDA30_001551 [Micrococcus cohnii]|uniref:Uncharacterized protein n=1 Tax=Micrococcus cohnii TaxID=993416 RepID=A0A7W7GPP8_9MICC|nr:hypothetical protein [Micrococcus cohnii]